MNRGLCLRSDHLYRIRCYFSESGVDAMSFRKEIDVMRAAYCHEVMILYVNENVSEMLFARIFC